MSNALGNRQLVLTSFSSLSALVPASHRDLEFSAACGAIVLA